MDSNFQIKKAEICGYYKGENERYGVRDGWTYVQGNQYVHAFHVLRELSKSIDHIADQSSPFGVVSFASKTYDIKRSYGNFQLL